jgi:3-oxoacyl-(acyl-carrier-protein) synthase/NAD(P)-dependent dehydrogenase (short-subunit alcohol dehydrogenase family)
LPSATRETVTAEMSRSFLRQFPEITEDTMPGELANIIAGRIANLFDFRGPSFTTDAACASGLAALTAARQGLVSGRYDAVVTGGLDRNMGPASFVKFCKIRALSATGSRPFDAGADGFVMGEGAALFVLKRLADAERDGDRIYAVLLGVGGSSDGRGKGITAPNPVGQRLAIARAWRQAGVDPATVSYIEAHGTSTRVGDAAELESMTAVFGAEAVAPGSIALGSVKSNIGHLKAAAGTAGLFKLAMALHEKVLPPSLNFRDPNLNVDWATSPFRVNTELREWPAPPCGIRRGGVSAFGFGGTNFHAVAEEHVPGRYGNSGRRVFAGVDVPAVAAGTVSTVPAFTGDMRAAERLPRRVPVPVLRPPAGWCKPTGVTLDGGTRVIVMADEGGVAGALVKRLAALGVTALVLPPALPAGDIESQLTRLLGDGPVHGLYWLPALDTEEPISDLDLPRWREALLRRVKNLHVTVRRLDIEGRLGRAGTFLVAATRLGGYHGYDDAGAVAPLGGAVTGFVKAYKRERRGMLAKVVDFPASGKAASLADALIEETRLDPGAVEIGRTGDRRWTVGLREAPFGDGSGGMALGSETVFAVTGAAGAIVSAIVADLAKDSGGIFYLLDLTPQPDPADEDLAAYATDRDGLRKAITERIMNDRASGKRVTPVLIERELARYERLHSALIAIQAVRDAGGKAFYHQVDLTDPGAVAGVMAGIRERHGRIDVLMHAAGIEISHVIADKDSREYDRVFDVKTDGLFNLLHAAGDMPIGATVVFSSVAGRFGNPGQTDYSAANDLLCKITSSFRTARAATRSIAVDWTAWDGLGMATRGSIPKLMARAGTEMLAPEAGIPWIRRELTAGPFSGEVIVGGQLGQRMGELDPTGGIDPSVIDTSAAGPMIGTITGMGIYSGLTVETTLDPAAQPFLNDHRIDGTPVLPRVMGAEAFAALAGIAAPGLRVAHIENMRLLAPLKFHRDEPRTVTLAAVVRLDGSDVVADCTLSTSRMLGGDSIPRRTIHFAGRVRLTRNQWRPTRAAGITGTGDQDP